MAASLCMQILLAARRRKVPLSWAFLFAPRWRRRHPVLRPAGMGAAAGQALSRGLQW